jgi:hypothetical protein
MWSRDKRRLALTSKYNPASLKKHHSVPWNSNCKERANVGLRRGDEINLDIRHGWSIGYRGAGG